MSYRAALALFACLHFACQAPSEKADPFVPQYVSGDQMFHVQVDDLTYEVNYVLPPGRWDGPRKTDGAVITYSRGEQHLWVSFGEMKDFDQELVHFRKLTEGRPYDTVDFRLVEPDRRADLVAGFRTEDGVGVVNRFVTVWPDPGLPVGVVFLAQARETDPLDIEPVLRSIRVARK